MRRWLLLGCVLALSGCSDRLPESSNELPFGVIDVPVTGATVARVSRVSGWALDDSRIVRVDLYVNGHFSGSTSAVLPRPDVGKAFPAYERQALVSGWEIAVDLGEGSTPRTLLAQAVDDNGATRDLGVLSLNVIGR